MKTRKSLLVLLFLNIYLELSYCETLSLIGSRLISSDGDSNVFISATNLEGNAIIKVNFKAGNNLVELKTYEEEYGNIFESLKLPISEYPEYDTYELTVSHSLVDNNITNQQTVKLFNPSLRPNIIIQTDKLLYNVGDVINFRILALTKNLIPFNYETMNVLVKDSTGKIVDQFNSNRTMSLVFTNSLKIAKKPNLGKWNIEVLVDGVKKVIEIGVQEGIGSHMELKADKFVAFSTRIVELRLYIHERTFSGTVRVSASGYQVGNNRKLFSKLIKSVDATGGENKITIDLAYDMDLNTPNTDIDIKFIVEVVESKSKKTSKLSADVRIKHEESRVFEVIKSKNFRPGFKFPIKILVKNFDGTLDQSYENLKITVRSFGADNSELSPQIFNKKVFDGVVNLEIPTNKEAMKIKLNLQFRQTLWNEEITAVANQHNEYLQLTLDSKNKSVGDVINVQAETTAYEMEVLHVMVIGPNGIILVEDYNDAQGKDIFNFSIPITKEMQPMSTIIAYYVRGDGVIIYDGYKFEFGSAIDSLLKINTVMSAKPNADIEVDVISERNSKIFLTATSSDLDFNKLISTKVHSNFKFRDLSQYEFGQFNGFVLEPLKFTDKSIENDDPIDLDLGVEITEKFSSDTWFFEDITGQRDVKLRKKTPSSTKIWHIFGFSMHPTKGLSIASSAPKITVNSDVIAKIDGPEHIKSGEIVKIDYYAESNLHETINVNMVITIKNGKILKEKIRNKCHNFTEAREDENVKISNDIEIPAKAKSEFKSIFIQPTGSKSVEVILQILTPGYKNDISKIINVAAESKKIVPVGDVLKSAMMYLDNTLTSEMELDEYKIYKFTASIIKYKYLKAQNNPDLLEVIKQLKQEYQEILRIIDNLINSKGASNLKLIAYAANSLLDAREIITVDEKVIKNSLDYIAKHQSHDGDFSYNNIADSRRNVGPVGFQIPIQNALLILPFLQDQNLKDKYHGVISKTMKKLSEASVEASNDYEKIIIANALMQNGDSSVLSKLALKHNYLKSLYAKHKPMFVEIVSYLISLKTSNADEQIKWLLNEMTVNNGFYSPYDAILAAKALMKASKTSMMNLNQISVDTKNMSQKLQESFSLVPSIMKNSNDLLVISINSVYNSVNVKSNQTNLVIIEIELPSGYKYHSYSEVKAQIKQVDFIENGGRVIIYINNMEANKNYQQKVYAEKIYDIYETSNLSVKIYDYYCSNLRKEATLSYDVNKQNCKEQKEFDLLDY